MGVWVGVARSQRVGVEKNWVPEVSVGTNRGAGGVRRVKGTGSFVKHVKHDQKGHY